MEKKVMHFYRPLKNGLSELCFNIETIQFLSNKELKTLVWVLSETFEPWKFGLESFLPDKKKVTEVGPRLNVATPFNTNALSILKSCGLGEKVTRLEVSRRYAEIEPLYDKMTECIYPEPVKIFSSNQKPEEVYEVNLLKKGVAAFDEIDGLSMDEHDKQAYYYYFVGECRRNPTIVEILDLNNATHQIT